MHAIEGGRAPYRFDGFGRDLDPRISLTVEAPQDVVWAMAMLDTVARPMWLSGMRNAEAIGLMTPI